MSPTPMMRPRGEGAELADGRHQQSGEGQHDGQRGGRDDLAGAAQGHHEALVRRLLLGQLLAVAEQHEHDVVGADAEHHDDQEWRQLSADGEAEPLGEECGQRRGHLVHQPDDDEGEEGNDHAAEDQGEQAEDQQHGGDRNDLLGPVERARLIDRDGCAPGELPAQTGIVQEGVGVGTQRLDSGIGAVLARLARHGDLNQLHGVVLGQEQRRRRDRRDRVDVRAVE
ncbi:MAG TPA: hypothetical protein VHX67_00175 [Acidimicrobiales bacterium]|jgi:hypothetical protein|nr:hypothetical protein [Acidimicrobiales bacterium]